MRSTHLPQQLVFGLLGLALATPVVYLMLGLPLLMRQHGWSGSVIGLFQLAGLPALFKAFLAVPVDRWRPARQPYVRWTALLGAAYVAILLALSALGLDTPRPLLFALMLVASVLATWIDVPVSALAIKMLPESERQLAGGIRSAVLFAAAVLGGGAMLLLTQAQGWSAPFLAMAALLTLALAALALLREPVDVAPRQPRSRGPHFAGFFRQSGAWRWAVLLLCYFPFVATAWIYLKPLLLDQGFPVAQVAWIAGVGGGSLGIVASLATGCWVRRAMLPRVLPLSAAANCLVLALLATLVWRDVEAIWVAMAGCLLAIAMGMTSSLAFALMMDFAQQHRQAVDYGIQASLFALGRLIVPPVAGLLLDHQGYAAMLLALALAALSVVALSALRPLTSRRESA
ncbi:MFS transporter [uncultured Herbaspirillum sp.]|uniref:MFS transporter n=1 Tax=uncultured Herbaspirillum sp. TaxID=160236 RepID=UPI00258CA8F4|nr:MFS transporter [uncultured Herbaspirillum sp.]